MSAGRDMAKPRVNRFWSTVGAFVVIYALVKWGIPAASREVTGLPFPLPVPGALVFIYMTLAVVALAILVTFSDEYLNEFVGPVKKFLRGDYGRVPRMVVLVAMPLLVGWQVYAVTVPDVAVPASLRIQHPSSNFPKSFETLKNPLASPSDADVQAFIEQAKANTVAFIPQVAADVKRWREANAGKHALDFIPTSPMKKFVAALKSDSVDQSTAKAALLEKTLFEGRALYAMNCRACHGDSTAGDGPMADGFKLRPINFTDNGTIETIVEGYTFWRVTNGGPGLPTEATPWDSAMPEWKLSLTEEERWKIIFAEYDLAQKTPRIPESH
ncbi:MAG: c-type cytochrome [Betaproteobacteria bacterium]|nr:c-type cytochrome [Betaproteobacteria bacterium]